MKKERLPTREQRRFLRRVESSKRGVGWASADKRVANGLVGRGLVELVQEDRRF